MTTKTMQVVQHVALSNMEDGGHIPKSDYTVAFKLTSWADDRSM